MTETAQHIETRLKIPPDAIPEFDRVRRTEHRPTIMNTAERLFLLGLEEWTRRNPAQDGPVDSRQG